MKIEFYTLDFLSCWPIVLPFSSFVLHSPDQQTQIKPLRSSFSTPTRPKSNPEQTPLFFIQFEPSPPPRFSPSHYLEPFSWFPFSIFAGIVFLFNSFARIVFISLVRCGLVLLFSLLGLCFWSLYKLKPRRFDLAHQARASKTRYITSNSSVLDSWC